MPSGKRRHLLTLQQLVPGSPQQKPTGEPDESWAAVGTAWGDIRQMRGIAAFTAAQQQSGIEVEIEVLYRSDWTVTAKMRWVEGSTIYDIKDVDDTMKHKGKLITRCSRGLNDG